MNFLLPASGPRFDAPGQRHRRRVLSRLGNSASPSRSQQLFLEFAQIGPALPLYAVNVSIPLIDIDPRHRSHRHLAGLASLAGGAGGHSLRAWSACPFSAAIAVLMDYRTMHTGLPNGSTGCGRSFIWSIPANGSSTTTIIAAACRWTFRWRISSVCRYELHALMMRAFQQAIRARQYRQADNCLLGAVRLHSPCQMAGWPRACASRCSRKVRAPRKHGAG